MEGCGITVVLSEGGGEAVGAIHLWGGAKIEVVGEGDLEQRLDGRLGRQTNGCRREAGVEIGIEGTLHGQMLVEDTLEGEVAHGVFHRRVSLEGHSSFQPVEVDTGNQRFLCIIIGLLLDNGGQDNHLFDGESGMVSLTVAIVVEFLFHTLHELLRRDCPEEFVSVLENKIKTVERNIEVVVHQLTVEILIELLRGAEFADGETDRVLLPVAEFSDEREFIHVRVNDIGARTDTLVKSQDICHEAECRRSIKAVAKGLEGGALGEVDATGLGVGGRGFQKGNSS